MPLRPREAFAARYGLVVDGVERAATVEGDGREHFNVVFCAAWSSSSCCCSAVVRVGF